MATDHEESEQYALWRKLQGHPQTVGVSVSREQSEETRKIRLNPDANPANNIDRMEYNTGNLKKSIKNIKPEYWATMRKALGRDKNE